VALAGNEIFWLTFAVQPAIDKVSLYNLSALPSGKWEMKSGSGGKMCGKRRTHNFPIISPYLPKDKGDTLITLNTCCCYKWFAEFGKMLNANSYLKI